MTYWIAAGGWNYEGFDDPVGVYSTKEKAIEALARAYKGYDFRTVWPCELDQEVGRAESVRPEKEKD